VRKETEAPAPVASDGPPGVVATNASGEVGVSLIDSKITTQDHAAKGTRFRLVAREKSTPDTRPIRGSQLPAFDALQHTLIPCPFLIAADAVPAGMPAQTSEGHHAALAADDTALYDA